MTAARRARRMNSGDLTRCILCSRRPAWRGIWVPSEPIRKKLGIDSNQTITYSLCPRCERQPHKLTKIEAKILAERHAELCNPNLN